MFRHCRSKQLFKTALGGKARSSFDGTIQVAEKAIQTEADQLSRYLLLSPEARASAKPQLKFMLTMSSVLMDPQ